MSGNASGEPAPDGARLRVAVFGAGAVGGYFGARLARAGQEVAFIARGEHLRAMKAHGLRVESLDGDFALETVQATDDPAEVGIVDVVLVGVKAWQMPEAARAMRPLVGQDTIVVPLLNGVEAPGQLAAALGEEHVLGGLCRIFSTVVSPGRIRHFGSEPTVVFGELDNRSSERAERLRRAFLAAGVRAEVPPDIHVALWEKFLFVETLGSVGTVTRAPVGIVRGVPEVRRMVEQAMEEVVAVARARGVALPEDAIAEALAYLDGRPAEATASMQRDIGQGRPSELGSQTGAVVRLGREAGVPTPLHTFLYHSLLPLEMRARGELAFPE